MEISIGWESLDNLVKRFSARGVFSGISDRISPFLKDALHLGRDESDRNEPIKKEGKNGQVYDLGYIVDMDSFPKDKFKPHELALIDYSDRVSKNVHKGLSRDVGGPYETHPKDMLDEYFEICSRLGISPDYRVVSTIIQHDIMENYRKIKQLSEELKHDIRKNEKLHRRRLVNKGLEERIESLITQIKEQRVKFVKELYSYQNLFTRDYTKANGLEEGIEQLMLKDGVFILGDVDWLTRYIEERFFLSSAYFLSQRHSINEYRDLGIGGPFQSEVMNALGIENGQEPQDYFWARNLGRVLDRNSLSNERKLRFSLDSAKRHEDTLQSDPTLREIYGKIDFWGKDMPRAYNLNILYRNFVVLHNLNLALGSYGKNTFEHRSIDPFAFDLMRVVIEAREHLIQINDRITDELKESYREDLGGRIASEVEKEVKETNPEEFEKVTGKGPISRGAKLDTEYIDRRKWEELDEGIVGKIENYRDVLYFKKLREIFSDTKRNVLDLERGIFSPLFTIDGLTYQLKVTYNPSPGSVTKYKQS